jgi:hypothetical protein
MKTLKLIAIGGSEIAGTCWLVHEKCTWYVDAHVFALRAACLVV